jgi:hypothetical protein
MCEQSTSFGQVGGTAFLSGLFKFRGYWPLLVNYDGDFGKNDRPLRQLLTRSCLDTKKAQGPVRGRPLVMNTT